MAVTPAPNKPARGNTLQARGKELNSRRRASGAMQREEIAWRHVLRQRRIPGDDLRCAAEVQPCSRQRRHVQRLADMARGIPPPCMLVVKRSGPPEILR